MVFAIHAHREHFERYLLAGAAGSAACRARITMLDATELLAELTRDGHVHAQAFEEVVGELMRDALAGGRPVYAYGEMVGVLWQEGKLTAAIELERLWNELAEELPFSLACGYPRTSMSDADAHALEQVCRLHSGVTGDARLRALGCDDGHASLEITARFPGGAEAPVAARRLLANALRGQGCSCAAIDGAVLVLSELTTNAVKHVAEPFHVEITLVGSTLRLSVHDAQPEPPDAPMPVCPPHGLAIIDTLAARWGAQSEPGGKAVWAELSL